MSNFEIVRIILAFVITIMFALLIKRYLKSNTKKVYLFSILLFLLLDFLLSQAIFENKILRFSSPEAACGYYVNSKIDHVIVDKNLAEVSTESGNYIFYKEDNKWKIPGNFLANPVHIEWENYSNYEIVAKSVQGLDESFVFITEKSITSNGEIVSIVDSISTEYKIISIFEPLIDKYFVTHYASVKGDLSNYKVEINGTIYSLGKLFN